MFSKRFLFAVAVLFWLSQDAMADDNGLSTQYSQCMDNSGGVTVSMLDCIAAETKVQDGRLNKAYKEVMSQLSAERKKQLKEAQRAWIKFRDANCDFYFDPEGGTLAGVMASDCVMSETAERAAELEGFLEIYGE